MWSQNTPCAFIASTLRFAGTPAEQASYLLRPVMMYGRLGEPLKRLPAPLEELIGKRVTVDKAALKRHLLARNIHEADLGGALSDPLSLVNGDKPDQEARARYFVIHDTSTPNYGDKPMASNINDAAWEWNDLHRKWINVRVAHVFINRVGESVTAVDFGSLLAPSRYGTKFARDKLKEKAKGLQLHIELVQPRRRDPQGVPNNDAIAPVPGFTEAQMNRLALVYVAASVRHGRWLIPAFHAAVDAGIPDAHDDPQNFDLSEWAGRLRILLKSLRAKDV